ncbi:MAG: hypothetical protein ABSH04_07215 [Acidimicrobiales bacterium]|jgi:hypothetical protein
MSSAAAERPRRDPRVPARYHLPRAKYSVALSSGGVAAAAAVLLALLIGVVILLDVSSSGMGS